MEERTTPAINGLPDKPPSEPPRLLENKVKNINHHEEAQWLEDATTSADIMLQHMNTHHATTLGTDIYIPSIRKITMNPLINDIHISNKRQKYDRRHRHGSQYSIHHQNQPQFIFQFQNHSYKIILHFRI